MGNFHPEPEHCLRVEKTAGQPDRALKFSSTNPGEAGRLDQRPGVTRRVSPESKQVAPAQMNTARCRA